MSAKPNSSVYSLRHLPTWLVLGLLRVLALLPLPLLFVVGYLLGWLFYFLAVPRRRIALTNISACFPEKDIAQCKRINQQHFCLLGQSILTAGLNWWVSVSRFERLVTVTGRAHYDQALAEGKNVILLAPHFIALETGGVFLSRERPMVSMYQHTKNQAMNEAVKNGRGRFQGRFDSILVERKEPLRNLIKLIRKGYPFYYLPDQDAGRKGVFVPFFHPQASTIPMLGKFTAMSNAVVIPCHNIIKPWGQGYEVRLGKPLVDFPVGDDIVDTTKMNQAVEAMIRQTPEQYFWVHKRFKTRPQGEAKFYQ